MAACDWHALRCLSMDEVTTCSLQLTYDGRGVPCANNWMPWFLSEGSKSLVPQPQADKAAGSVTAKNSNSRCLYRLTGVISFLRILLDKLLEGPHVTVKVCLGLHVPGGRTACFCPCFLISILFPCFLIRILISTLFDTRTCISSFGAVKR